MMPVAGAEGEHLLGQGSQSWHPPRSKRLQSALCSKLHTRQSSGNICTLKTDEVLDCKSSECWAYQQDLSGVTFMPLCQQLKPTDGQIIGADDKAWPMYIRQNATLRLPGMFGQIISKPVSKPNMWTASRWLQSQLIADAGLRLKTQCA